MTRTTLKSIPHIDATHGGQALDRSRDREDIVMHVNAPSHSAQDENSDNPATIYL